MNDKTFAVVRYCMFLAYSNSVLIVFQDTLRCVQGEGWVQGKRGQLYYNGFEFWKEHDGYSTLTVCIHVAGGIIII